VVAHEVNIQTKLVVTGPDAGKSFTDINPKGNVPCLVTEAGVVLSEGPSVHLFLSELAPEALLAPAAGIERLQFIDTFNFIGSDIHAGVFGLLWGSFYDEGFKALKPFAVKKLTGKLAHVEANLLQGGKRQYLTGSDAFTSADACESRSPKSRAAAAAAAAAPRPCLSSPLFAPPPARLCSPAAASPPALTPDLSSARPPPPQTCTSASPGCPFLASSSRRSTPPSPPGRPRLPSCPL
jgi:glutathione S-transferase